MTPTPSSSDSLPLRFGDFSTLVEALDYAGRAQTGFNFYSARGQLAAVLPFAELREKAIGVAQGLIKAGLPPRARVVLVADTDPHFITMFFACQYAGLLAAPVTLPAALGGKEGYISGLRRQLEGCGASAAMAPAELLDYLKEAADGLGLSLIGSPEDFYALPRGDVPLRPFGPDDPGYLQYSSGSTRHPHGVDIPQRALTANCYAIINHGLKVRAGDRGTSWLPLYHDMGLVGFMLSPLLCQLSVDYMATRDFARRPLLWLTLMSQNGGTLAYSPTFGYDLCARRASTGSKLDIDISRWRAAGVGGDMVQPGVLARFADAFREYGFRAEAFVPSYGMAETVLAVSFAELNTGVIVDHVDRQRMTDERLAVPAADADPKRARDFVACGRPLPLHTVDVRDDDGKLLPERHIGRIFVRGPSVMAGYYNEPEATALVLDTKTGWLDTGDLGYLLDGQIVITGRAKDLIIINGRNIWPQDLEWAVEELPQVRKGDVAAIAVEGAGDEEEAVILIECRLTDTAARADLVREVEGVIRRAAAIECRVVLVEPRSL